MAIYPTSFWGHIVVLVESFTGLVGVALITAVLYSKFSRPKARVAFRTCSAHGKGKQYLRSVLPMARGHTLINVQIKLSALVSWKDIDGKTHEKACLAPSPTN